MGFYGNKWVEDSIKSESVKVKEELYTIESVVYDEYCNYKSLLENASGYDAILEAKVEVLEEVSIADIKQKIKELWQRFKDFIKKIWDKIFDRKKIATKRNDDAVKKAKETISKAKSKGVKLESVLLEEDNDEERSGLVTMADDYYYYFASLDQSTITGNADGFVTYRMNQLKDVRDKFEGLLHKLSTTNMSSVDAKEKISNMINTISYNKKIRDENEKEIKIVTSKYKKRSNYEDAVNDYNRFSARLKKDLEYLESGIKDIKKDIDNFEKNINQKIDTDNAEFNMILAKMSSKIITIYNLQIKEFSTFENIILSQLDTFTNEINRINAKIEKKLDDKIKKFMDED